MIRLVCGYIHDQPGWVTVDRVRIRRLKRVANVAQNNWCWMRGGRAAHHWDWRWRTHLFLRDCVNVLQIVGSLLGLGGLITQVDGRRAKQQVPNSWDVVAARHCKWFRRVGKGKRYMQAGSRWLAHASTILLLGIHDLLLVLCCWLLPSVLVSRGPEGKLSINWKPVTDAGRAMSLSLFVNYKRDCYCYSS